MGGIFSEGLQLSMRSATCTEQTTSSTYTPTQHNRFTPAPNTDVATRCISTT